MSIETKKFFNNTIKEIYQQTGAILSLENRSERQLLINSLKIFEARVVYNWQQIVHPILNGPKGSPYQKYSGMRSKPWAEFDSLDTVYGGLSGWTITAEPWATAEGMPCLWDSVNNQPHSITGALYCLSNRIEALNIIQEDRVNDLYDDTELKADIYCLENNMNTLYKDVYGCNYTLDCDGEKQKQWSIYTHLYQIFNQLVDGAPTLSIDSSCEDAYPSMSIYMPVSNLTYDIKIPASEIEGCSGDSILDDFQAIYTYVGMDDCDSVPYYGESSNLCYISNGDPLNLSIAILDREICNLSNVTPDIVDLQKAYDNGDDTNKFCGNILLSTPTVGLGGGGIHINVPFRAGFINDFLFNISDDYLSSRRNGSDYCIRDSDLFTVGEHEVYRKAEKNSDFSLVQSVLADFEYPNVNFHKSILTFQPTAGIPNTRDFESANYNGASTDIDTALWVSSGRLRDCSMNTSVFDCDGVLVGGDNLYFRHPNNGTIFRLNKCGEGIIRTSDNGTFNIPDLDYPSGALIREDNEEYRASIAAFTNPDNNGLTVGWNVGDYSSQSGAISEATFTVSEITTDNIGASLDIRTLENGSLGKIRWVNGQLGNTNELASIVTSVSNDFIFSTNDDSKDIVFKPYNTENLRLLSNGNAAFSGSVLVSGDLIVNGTTTTINSTTLQVDDKNIELGTVDNPTDATADGGGITLKGTSDKTIKWVYASDSWELDPDVKVKGNLIVEEILTVEDGLTINGGDLTLNSGNVNVTGDVNVSNYLKLGTESGSEGSIRYNTISNEFEGHDGTSWGSLGGSADNLGNHIATQDLAMGTNYITGSKLRFKDTTAANGTTGDYFFYGKYDSTPGASPASMPAKIIMYADDGNTASGRGEYIALQPPDAGQLNGSYEIKLPSGQPAASKILKVSQMQGTIAVMSWEDECCPESATSSTEGTVILAHPTTPVSSSTTGDEVVTITSLSAIPLTQFDDTGFTVASGDVTGLSTVATSGSYNDLSNTPTIPTDNNQLTNGAGYLTSIDLNSLTGTTGIVSKFAIVSNGASRTITPANIDISIFNNDAGYVTTDTNTTYTAGTGLSLSGTTFNLATAGIGAGTYGSISDSIKIDQITVDAYGRVTNITTGSVSGGGSGTVTSITANADTGTGTAITTSGTITIAGGENVETSVSGTTVTINAPRTFGSIAFDMNSGNADPGRNIHSTGNLTVFNETQIQLYRSSSTDRRLQFNVEKGYSVGDVITMTNNTEATFYIEAVAVNTWSSTPTLQSKFKGYYPAVSVAGNNECQFGAISSSSLNTYEIIVMPGNSTIKLHCSNVISGSATFEVHKA